MIGALVSSVRFLWTATAGYRLRPWRSPYLRWRLETYTGKPAGTIVVGDFLRLAWGERGQVLRFLRWMGEMARLSRAKAQ